MDDTNSHNFWLYGVDPQQLGDNRFTHYLWNAPGYDDPAMNNENGWWGIDGYMPVMEDISSRFKQQMRR